MVLRKPAEHNKSLIVEPIVQGTTKSGFMADRYLVFCRTYPETVELFQEAVLQLTTKKHCFYRIIRSLVTLQDMWGKNDACTGENMKRHIIKSFTEPAGTVWAVFATTTFAMGLDSPNARYIVHWGHPADTKTYIQEIGRSGHNGRFVYSHRTALNSAVNSVKDHQFQCITDCWN